MSSIVVSYRKSDTKFIAGRIGDSLVTSFGDRQVRVGVENLITPGDDYADAIESGIKQAQVLIVLIGSGWLNEPWLNNSQDYDRLALLTALNEKKRVLPILIDGATMPTADQLPAEFASLARRTGLSVSEDTFRADIAPVVDTLKKAVEPPANPVPQMPPPEPTVQNVPSGAAFIPNDPMPRQYRDPAPAGASYAADPSRSQQNTMSNNYSGNYSGGTGSSGGSIVAIDALSYPFSDPSWMSKFVILLLINFLPIIGQIITTGYGLRVARLAMDGKRGLPELNDWGADFGNGLVYAIALFIYGIAFAVLAFIPCIGQLLLLAASPIIVYSSANYLKQGSFGAFFDFGGITNFFTKNTNQAVMLLIDSLLLSFIISILAGIGFALLIIPGIIVSIAGIYAYFYLVGRWAARIV
jgi:hypothetical protein